MTPIAERPSSLRFRHLLEGAFQAAIQAVRPDVALPPVLPEPPSRGRIIVLAVGKAADAMAREVERHYAARGVSLHGVVVVPHGTISMREPTRLPRLEASHPVPDDASRRAGDALLAQAAQARADDLVLALVSGGGSALAVSPDGVTLDALTQLHDALLRSGAAIEEMNLVRRQLDRVKGGGLAAAAAPARVVTLALSDVVGDDPRAIASGPTIPDSQRPADALNVLDRYGIGVPEIRARLRDLEHGDGQARTRSPERAAFGEDDDVHVIATNRHALEAARRYLLDAGIDARVLADDVTGDAREAGRAAARDVEPYLAANHERLREASMAFLTGGETTVTVRGSGRGGRNSTFALAFALALPEHAPVHALIADSDGVDGVGGHAGAFVDPDLFDRVDRSVAEALDANDDSHAVFDAADALFRPGPTGTNVNDLRFILLPAPSRAEDA